MQSNEWRYVAVCVGVAFKLNSAAKHKCARYRTQIAHRSLIFGAEARFVFLHHLFVY